jgi:hypothetical protein
MPNFTDFVIIQDHGITIPHGGVNDFHFDPFDAPGAVGPPSILTFRLKSTGRPQLTVLINNVALVTDAQLEPGPDRSWHETITQLRLEQTENLLDMAIRGNGSVTVSDVVLFYQRSAE